MHVNLTETAMWLHAFLYSRCGVTHRSYVMLDKLSLTIMRKQSHGLRIVISAIMVSLSASTYAAHLTTGPTSTWRRAAKQYDIHDVRILCIGVGVKREKPR
jgi:hypothetical protein